MKRKHQRRCQPMMEALEDRLLLSYTYAMANVGAMHVARGHDLYISLQASSTSAPAAAENVWTSWTAPAGVTVSSIGNNYFYQLSSSSGTYSLLFKISVSAGATVGPAVVTITGDSAVTHVRVSDPINIVIEDMPAALSAPQFNTAPLPIDATVLSNWESRMTTWGAVYGTTAKISAPGDESGSWYYDGERVFYQIQDYTGNSSWKTQAETSEAAYRPYVLNNNGGIPGWRDFGQGLAMDYEREPALSQERTDDATAVVDLFTHAAVYEPNMTDVSWSRETAYCVDSGLMAHRIGQAIDDVKLQRYVDVSLGFIDQWFVMKYVNTAGYIIQPFMVGLTCEALIGWYQYTVQRHAQDSNYPIDTRIPAAVKTAADWLVGQTGGLYNAWNPTHQAFNYMIHYATPNVDIREATAVDAGVYDNQLNQLIVPAFGWLYHMYGETNGATYRQWGDTIFAGGVACSLDTGKQFSQNYRWSGDYVQWRTNNPWGLDTTAPVVSQFVEKALTATGDYITWKTDEAVSSVVEYGLTNSYGSTLTNALLMKNHRQEITGLTSGATYHYRIKATDASGNVTYSSDRTFVAGVDTLTLTVAATDAYAKENTSDTGMFTFTRSSGVGALTVNFILGGSATNGTDYQMIGMSVVFADGQTVQTVTVTPLNDSQQEPTEFATVSLFEGSGYDLGAGTTATVKLLDDDLPLQTVTVTATDAQANENPVNTGKYRVTRSSGTGALTVLMTVPVVDSGVTNGVDIQMLPTSLTFAPGETYKDVTLTVIDDDMMEGQYVACYDVVEDPAVTYLVGSPSRGTVYILSSDSRMSLVGTDMAATEAGDMAVFTINRSTYDNVPLTLYYTVTGTATNGVDFQSLPGTLSFASNEMSKTISVRPIDDDVYEGPETVTITLTAPVGCEYDILYGNITGTATISDDDSSVDVTAPDPNASQKTLDGGAWRLTRTGNTDRTLVVNYAFSGGVLGRDFIVSPTGTSVTFAIGETTKDIVLSPIDSHRPDADVTLSLVTAAGCHYSALTSASAAVHLAGDLLPGDANGDAIVDQADYTVWYNSYGSNGVWANGDFNGDHLVDQADYTLWYNNYGASGGSVGTAPAGGSVASADAQQSTVDLLSQAAASAAAPAASSPTFTAAPQVTDLLDVFDLAALLKVA